MNIYTYISFFMGRETKILQHLSKAHVMLSVCVCGGGRLDAIFAENMAVSNYRDVNILSIKTEVSLCNLLQSKLSNLLH